MTMSMSNETATAPASATSSMAGGVSAPATGTNNTPDMLALALCQRSRDERSVATARHSVRNGCSLMTSQAGAASSVMTSGIIHPPGCVSAAGGRRDT